jgi:hypothetical protein
MNWNAAIEKNREALKRVLAMLVAMAGSGATLPRHLHRKVLRLLRPAEAAARRLIVVAACGLVVTLPPRRPRKPKPASIFVRDGKGTGILMPRHLRHLMKPSRTAPRTLALPLLDKLQQMPRPRRPVLQCVPRSLAPGFSTPFPVPVRCPLSAIAPRSDRCDASFHALPGAGLGTR